MLVTILIIKRDPLMFLTPDQLVRMENRLLYLPKGRLN